ncbi:MAG: hypothetical protein HWE35_04165 [Rhodobacteraceae bacterium]|nr:hypothetical protein [Paracoccaceae bacterium]
MKYLLAAGSRSGSEFSIRLLKALTGDGLAPMGKVHSARQSEGELEPSYRECKAQGAVAEFVTRHRLRSLKLEDPGVDGDAFELFRAFPEATVIATFRPVEKIINSHGNIKPWGMAPEQVVRNWTGNLAFYEAAARAGRLVLIPMEDKAQFDAEAAAARLGCAVADSWQPFLEEWPRINDLKAQKQVSKDESEISFAMSRDEVLAAFPQVHEAEARYKALVRYCNHGGTARKLETARFSEPLFKVPFCLDAKRVVAPYTPFAGQFEIGASGPAVRVAVQQRCKEGFTVSPPDHAFEFEVDAAEAADSKWLTLECALDPQLLFPGAQVTALLSLRSTLSEPFSLVLRIRRRDGSFEDLTLGALTAAADGSYTQATMSRFLDPLAAVLREDGISAQLILFAPPGRALQFSLSMFNVFISRPYCG